MKPSLSSLLFAALVLLGLGGCDISGSENISGGPINAPDAILDPTDPANIAVYFYLDRPVAGLYYRCSGASTIPYQALSDENGRIVCPRKSILSLYVGGVDGLQLGSVTLSMYGAQDADDARNYVTINPGTLFGTTADRDRNEVLNMFNLLTSLDVGGSGAQAVIHLSRDNRDIHELVQPFAATLNLSSTPEAFSLDAIPMLNAVNDSTEFDLVNGGTMMTVGAAGGAVDLALRKARAGIYSGTPLTMAGDNSNKRAVYFSYSMLVSHSGYTTGMAYGQFIDSNFTPATQEFDVFTLAPGAIAAADGTLENFVLQSDAGRTGAITGRFVNDRLFGLESQLINESTAGLPPDYVYASSDPGQFRIDEPGTTIIDDFLGDLTMYLGAPSTTDVDLDLLPADGTLDRSPGVLLPLDYAILTQGYANGVLVTDDTEKLNPALLVDQPPLRFRIRPDGDIVSDIDGDCSPTTEVAGRLYDVGGEEEFVIGQVGALFKGEDQLSYLTFALAVFAPEHPAFGFVMGTAPLVLKNELGTVVLNTTTGEIRPKTCRPGIECTDILEWMNDAVLVRQVFTAISANDPAVDDSPLYKRPDYYGRVTAGTRYCISEPI